MIYGSCENNHTNVVDEVVGAVGAAELSVQSIETTQRPHVRVFLFVCERPLWRIRAHSNGIIHSIVSFGNRALAFGPFVRAT